MSQAQEYLQRLQDQREQAALLQVALMHSRGGTLVSLGVVVDGVTHMCKVRVEDLRPVVRRCLTEIETVLKKTRLGVERGRPSAMA